LRVFEIKVLRRILGFKKEEVAGDWRRLHNEEFRNLYASPNITRLMKLERMRWAEHVTRMGQWRNVYRNLVGKFELKRLRGRTRRRWEDNIRMDLREIGWEIVDWIRLNNDSDQWRALVNTVMSLRVTLKAGNFLTS
jgi:hypothetical protein